MFFLFVRVRGPGYMENGWSSGGKHLRNPWSSFEVVKTLVLRLVQSKQMDIAFVKKEERKRNGKGHEKEQ